MAIVASPMQWAQTQTPDDLWPHLHAGMGGVSGSARCRSLLSLWSGKCTIHGHPARVRWQQRRLCISTEYSMRLDDARSTRTSCTRYISCVAGLRDPVCLYVTELRWPRQD